MLASRDAEETEGIVFAAAASATPVNLELLTGRGFELPADLVPDDLLIAIEGVNDAALDRAAAAIEALLSARPRPAGDTAQAAPRSLRSAAGRDPDLNLAFVSVPGRYAAYEVAGALEAGLNVFCFSDGVSLEAEVVLKRRAAAAGLLLMGPDCGTAIVSGVGLGFANVVRRGPVGIVGASGTGTQEICCLLDAAGVGISHAIGVGGRDLSGPVGGLMTLAGIQLLADDPATEIICVVSKPPDPSVTERVLSALTAAAKPAVVALLGADDLGDERMVATLEAAAAKAAELAGGLVAFHEPTVEVPTPGAVAGLFAGGTLCAEAGAIVAASGFDARFVDFGDDEMTAGRAHPMIDPSLRNDAVARAALAREIGVIVLDVVLGHGAHPDPASELARVIRDALEQRDGDLTIIVTVCGTAGDPQGLSSQIHALEAAGALVTRSAASAGRLAVDAGGGG
ncbi:MAG: FdrA family protein [Actinobacteria bacterium]|nr:FdrA family protein [Actinomycetota bacterium]